MAKTACEEAAEALEMRNFPPALPKRLRAEGRELKRFRRLALAADSTSAYLVIRSLMREAARIQKARKAK